MRADSPIGVNWRPSAASFALSKVVQAQEFMSLEVFSCQSNSGWSLQAFDRFEADAAAMAGSDRNGHALDYILPKEPARRPIHLCANLTAGMARMD